MKAEIIAVGTELLLGDILNSNAQYLSKELAKLGIDVFFQTAVGDNPERILSVFQTAFSRADIVLTTGGLGPTDDDLTKEMAAKYFQKDMELDEESLKNIENIFKKQNLPMVESNKKQALIPVGATILKNEKGTAPGVMLEENGKTIFLMPGPTFEMTHMFENQVIPILQKKTDKVFFSKTLRISGIGESSAAEVIKDLIDNQTNPSIAPYAKTFEVHFRITASAENENQAEKLMEPTIAEMYKRFGENIYGENEKTLDAVVIDLLKSKGLKISCAESCTGGLLAARFVDNSGVSDVFSEGAVTYSNDAKVQRLGVSKETLEKFGAVSKEVAMEMAEGIAKTANSHVGISVTGVAGPDGGSEEKPVGLVYIGLSINGETSFLELKTLGDRQKIRTRAVASAFDFLRRSLIHLS